MTASDDAVLARFSRSSPVSFTSFVALAVAARRDADGDVVLEFPFHAPDGTGAGAALWTPSTDTWANPWPRSVYAANRLGRAVFRSDHVFVAPSPIDAVVIVEAFDLATPVVAVDPDAFVIDPAVIELGTSGRSVTVVTGCDRVVGDALNKALPSAAHIALPAPYGSLWGAAEALGVEVLPGLLRALRRTEAVAA